MKEMDHMPTIKEAMLGSLFTGAIETVSACAAFPQRDIDPWERTTRAFGNTRSDSTFFQRSRSDIHDEGLDYLTKAFIAIALVFAMILLMKKLYKNRSSESLSPSPRTI